MRILFLGLILGCFLNVANQAERTKAVQDNRSIEPGDLEVIIASDKHIYKRSDRLRLDVKLVNNNAVSDIFVYGTLQFGVRASFRLFRRDALGGEVSPRGIDSGWELPPKPNDAGSFVKLLPFHFLGKTYRSTIHLQNLDKPGKYTLWVEYQPPLSVSDVEFRPFFGKENGPIKSNVVSIEVVR